MTNPSKGRGLGTEMFRADCAHVGNYPRFSGVSRRRNVLIAMLSKEPAHVTLLSRSILEIPPARWPSFWCSATACELWANGHRRTTIRPAWRDVRSGSREEPFSAQPCPRSEHPFGECHLPPVMIWQWLSSKLQGKTCIPGIVTTRVPPQHQRSLNSALPLSLRTCS